MSSLQAIIFDIDGTLLDTREYILRGFEHALEKRGLPVRTREEIASQIGKNLKERYDFLAPGGEFLSLKAAHDAFQTANLALIRQYEAVRETLLALKEEGYSLALWTGRGHNVVESLEAAAVDVRLFETIAEPLHLTKGKPDPEGIFYIANTLGIPQNKMAMVGDAAVDILAGKSAGVAKTIAITHGFGTRQELESAKPDHVVDSFAEVLTVLK